MNKLQKISNAKLKLYSLGCFLGGVSLATMIYWGPQLKRPINANLEETVLAEMLYDNFQRYSDSSDIHNVTEVMSQIQTGHYTKLEKQKYNEILLELVNKKASRKALANLEKSEAYLAQIAESKSVLPVIDKKIYIEVLKEGFGDSISLEPTLSLHLKQYDETGKVIKDTGESIPSSITLSKMAKGFQIGIDGARVGEKRKIYIHPEYGFTKTKTGSSANHLLIYEVTIL